ncbi:MAG: RNA polymerase sigma factor [Candidatus Aminicenantes bacterium]|jgi:RNA polymerase sigma-70 factor (ECF subfamily)
MDTGKHVTEKNVCALVEQIKKGDREAFLMVTHLYQKKVFTLAYAFLRNTEDAMDIVQETFLRLYQKAEMFQRGKSFQNWLLQIAKNLCIDSYRKQHSKEGNRKEGKDISELNIRDPKASDTHQSSDMNRILSDCVDKLSERQRTVFLMKQYNQMEYREIAEILNIATGTVKSLHSKAIQNLRTLMSPYMGRQT